MGLVRVQNCYIDAASAQVFAPGLFGGVSFRGLKKLKGGQNTVKRKSERESSKKNLEESESFSVSKFSPATGVTVHSEPLPFSDLAETGSRQIIHISIRVLG